MHSLGRLIRSRTGVILLAAFLPIAVRLISLPWLPVPPPAIHDEFSFLLAADTFAHGRLTNPTHPMWRFFESFHILQNPTYMSMYPPLHGMVLAFGQLVLGHPFWAVCLSMALLCGLFCWVIEGWVPARWALAGTLLFAVKFMPAWTNSYWGGAVGGIGGCLLIGPLIRIGRATSVRRLTLYGVLMGLGAAVMVQSRPWEGLLIAIPMTLILLVWLFQSNTASLAIRFFRVIAPFVLFAAVSVAGMGYYNWRVTGSPVKMPYQVHWDTYRVEPLFLWQSERKPPEYAHEMMRRFHLIWEPNFHGANQQSTLKGWLKSRLRFAFALVLSAFLIALIFFRYRRMRVLALLLGVFLAGLCLQRYLMLHYTGAILPAVFASYMVGLRRLWTWRFEGRRLGRLGGGFALTAFICYFVYSAADRVLFEITVFGWKRQAIERQIAAIPGKHVVIVRYSERHWDTEEWVYNEADIDGARVVWARDMGSDANRKLRDYFRESHFWCLEPDRKPIQQVACPTSDHFIEEPARAH